MASNEQLIWVTPLPPLASGISQYSRDFLSAVSGSWPLAVLPEPGSDANVPGGFSTVTKRFARSASHRIVQIGNSGFHAAAFDLATSAGNLLVLHDVVLHHARLADFVRRGKIRDYVMLMESHYGSAGREHARDVLRGTQIDFARYPLSEDIIGAADLVAVHSQHAREQVSRIVAGAQVEIVPMGVPLPAVVDRQQAREHLGLSGSAFVVASITHVNPMKRLPVVLRAFRRVAERVPESLLVIAGSVSSSVNIEQHVAHLGLERHVRLTGYLDDTDARVLAQASDVAVNLRYPSTGETSASLLRLLGAGIPVIVTAHGASLEIPKGAALQLPVDRLEEETLSEYLLWLAEDSDARSAIGAEGRRFIERQHSLGAAIDGYRAAINSAWQLHMPAVQGGPAHEARPELVARAVDEDFPVEVDPLYNRVADALRRIGLANHDGTIQLAAEAIDSLGLQLSRGGKDVANDVNKGVDPELLEILACPVCKVRVRLDNDELICDSCGRHYRIENGIPIMLVEEAQAE